MSNAPSVYLDETAPSTSMQPPPAELHSCHWYWKPVGPLAQTPLVALKTWSWSGVPEIVGGAVFDGRCFDDGSVGAGAAGFTVVVCGAARGVTSAGTGTSAAGPAGRAGVLILATVLGLPRNLQRPRAPPRDERRLFARVPRLAGAQWRRRVGPRWVVLPAGDGRAPAEALLARMRASNTETAARPAIAVRRANRPIKAIADRR
jgi:hypothetical protein